MNNIRSAHWIIEAIEQRKNTLLKVAKAIVRHQRDFFEQGPLYLRPLPMSKIAEEVGVHLATVSRAVSGQVPPVRLGHSAPAQVLQRRHRGHQRPGP